ncbi:heparin lyase I family protein [Streptomyces formicae]|uniref:Heparin lyase I family protein n=1 Tax=Streptomyces formicae TaxID=1616117 RepID=A0ABY3WSP5_9ACTN|nr:heparin lyase I family protein [Streptomyces formicae]UNM12818.1 heparin lyase I family protein [Streptomyces formicae]
MRRRTLRSLLALPAIAAATALAMATPAEAAVVWNGDADNGMTFREFLCDSGNYVYTPDWGDGRGKHWGFVAKAGTTRCESYGVMVGGSEYNFTSGKAYWFGWEQMTLTDNWGVFFQWKSNGTGEQHDQNYPVIMMILEGRLNVWYVAPGEVWNHVTSVPWTAKTWHKLELGINAQSNTTGSFQLWLDGDLVTDVKNARTWDLVGNKPRWGVYDTNVLAEDQVNWVNGLTMGTTRGDVD